MSANYVTINGGGPTYDLALSTPNLSENNNEIRLLCKTSLGAVTIQLPPISAFKWGINAKIFIDDADDMAATNNITVLADASNTIDNNASYVIATNGCKAVLYISSLTEFAVLQSIGGGVPVPPAVTYTYAQLQARVAGNLLVKGQRYIISDFRTKHGIPYSTATNTGTIEPLMLTAMSANTFNSQVQSTVFPQDVIFYEFVDSTTAGGDRGRIYYRKSTDTLIETAYDWRNVKFRRWFSRTINYGALVGTFKKNETITGGTSGATARIVSDAAGVLTLKIVDGSFQAAETITGATSGATATVAAVADTATADNVYETGGLYQDVYTFGNSASAAGFYACSIAAITPFGIATYGAPTNYLNNITFGAAGSYINIGNDSFNNSIGAGTDLFVTEPAFINNVIGDTAKTVDLLREFKNNIIDSLFQIVEMGIQTQNNLIGSAFNGVKNYPVFTNNTIADNFVANVIGAIFDNNITLGAFTANIVQSLCSDNTFGADFQFNKIGNRFTNNTVGATFELNVIGDSCDNNIFGADSSLNVIDAGMASNTLGANFKRNQIGVSFANNTIGADCQDNVLGSNFGNAGGNTIGTTFQRNIIGSGFASNTIGNSFAGNNIADSFTGNTIGNGFQLVNCQVYLAAVNFGAATHVYANYSKNIVKNNAGNNKTVYLDDASGNYIAVAVNA